MNNLVAFLTKNFHWLLFLVLEIVSGVLLFHYNSYQGSVWVSSANSVTGKVGEWRSGVEQFFGLQRRAQELTVRNLELEAEHFQLRRRLLEAQADTAVTDSMMQQMTAQLQLIPSLVVGSTLNRPDNLLTINSGSADGVAPDMGVVCGTGLVGVVYMTSAHYAVVMPLLNFHSRVSCGIRGSGYFGYLTWEGKDPTVAYMEDIPRHAKFEEGDYVETSGYSNIFPQGITVGRIIGISNSADGLSYRLKVRLQVDFGCLREVYVIADNTFPERRELLMAARDSMELAR